MKFIGDGRLWNGFRKGKPVFSLRVLLEERFAFLSDISCTSNERLELAEFQYRRVPAKGTGRMDPHPYDRLKPPRLNSYRQRELWGSAEGAQFHTARCYGVPPRLDSYIQRELNLFFILS